MAEDIVEPAGGELPVELAGYTADLLRRAAIRAERAAHQVMPAGFRPRDFAVLGTLLRQGPASQQDLSEQLKVNRTVMVRVIDRLEEAGYVARQRDPRDRRSYALAVSPAGRRALTAALPALARGDAMLAEPLTDREKARLAELLRRLTTESVQGLPDEFRGRLGYLVTRAHLELRRRSDVALEATGLQSRHFSALAVLDGVGPVTQQDLARRLDTSEPAMVSLIDELELAGFVHRQRDVRDRRRYALSLTPSGKRSLTRAARAIAAVQSDLATGLGASAKRDLDALLGKLVAAEPGAASL